MGDAAPVLAFEGGLLAPFGPEHLTGRYVAWLVDQDVVRYSEQRHRSHDRHSCQSYVEAMAAAGNLFWAIEADDEDPKHIGNIVAYLDRANRVADMTILIGEKGAWGNGYGKAAWCAACDWLAGAGGMRKLTAGTMAANKPMLALMRASGMGDDGARRRQFLLDGEEVDLVMMARFADD